MEEAFWPLLTASYFCSTFKVVQPFRIKEGRNSMCAMGCLRGSIMIMLLLLFCGDAGSCPARCICSPVAERGQWVYCAISENSPFPALPNNTIILDLQGNRLREIPAGSLDQLSQLQLLWLQGNSLECGCKVLYLKHWLEDQGGQVVTQGAFCSLSSGTLKSIVRLTGNEYPSCGDAGELGCLVHVGWGVAALGISLLSLLLLSYTIITVRQIHKNTTINLISCN
nr:platelet glycoprotein IX-like [Paramormyrops kingsleyae]